MSASNLIRVAIFDDSTERRESLSYLIGMQENLLCVGAFVDGVDAVANVNSCKPDVILMDIDMPRVNGIEAVKALIASNPSLTIIMQTVFEDDQNLFDSIAAGASGYLLKKDDPSKIIAAIQDSVVGGASMSPGMAMKVIRYFKTTAAPENHDYALTDKEKIVLNHLVDGLSYKMIAGKESISYHTVNSHVRKIYEKLHVHSLGEAVSKALRERLL
ncbi:MAG: response regulator transcription factor [Flavobacteriales bacterium]|nr:response regulator transcription factor [Flavobacteriales bacterium]